MFKLGAGWYSVKPCDFRIAGLCPASAPANYSGRKSNMYATDLQGVGWPVAQVGRLHSEHALETFRRIANAEFAVVPDAGHLLCFRSRK